MISPPGCLVSVSSSRHTVRKWTVERINRGQIGLQCRAIAWAGLAALEHTFATG